MKNLRGLKFIWFCWVIIILVALSGCDSHDPIAGGAKLDEMSEILQSVAVHRSKIEVETDNHLSGSNVSITKKYKSDAPFDEIKEFYHQQLVNQGWHFVEEQELKDRGRFRDERVLHFKRGEFLLTVQFSARRGVDVGWDYALRIAYPSDWTKKV